MNQNDSYKYGGARVLIALHEQYLREFLSVWREADQREVKLPTTNDPNYASREALLAHVLRCGAHYLIWICEKLEVPAPGLEEYPGHDGIVAKAEQYMEQILDAWQKPLRNLTDERAHEPVHNARWGPPFCIDAMLEHAVMHPIRHTYQLRALMSAQSGGTT